MNPEIHDDNSRRTPRKHEDHDQNPRNKFEGKFDDKKTPQKPFAILFDYSKSINPLKKALEQGPEAFFEYIGKHQLPTPESIMDIIKLKDSDMYSELSNEFLIRPDSLADLSNTIALINDPVDLRTAEMAIANLEIFLNQD